MPERLAHTGAHMSDLARCCEWYGHACAYRMHREHTRNVTDNI